MTQTMTWTKPRLSELGLSAIGCDPIDCISRFQRMPENERKSDPRNAWLMKIHYLNYSSDASLNFLVLGDHANARKWAKTALESGETYFWLYVDLRT